MGDWTPQFVAFCIVAGLLLLLLSCTPTEERACASYQVNVIEARRCESLRGYGQICYPVEIKKMICEEYYVRKEVSRN
jgi:hypothetical protein